ncbi:hypothetical protein [Bacillus sp. 03113]|uniref:hypothetical protein n=1 Tax=Bacillus sp. 03113 TaxID=2578211 RepID=UPI001143AD59|nr:hypothetical protein [Bacillus sp. 03113]
MKEQKVYILLTDTGTIFSRLIKLYTRKPLNHASIAFDQQLLHVYSFGRKKSGNPFIAGFVKENIQGDLFKKASCAIYSCSISEAQYNTMLEKIKKMEAQKQLYKYNFLGVFAVVFNKRMDRKNAFFCSHFVATILDECGINTPYQKPLSLVTPNDLKELPSLQLEYNGKLVYYLSHTGSEKRDPFTLLTC